MAEGEARAYARIRYRLTLIDLAVSLAFLGLLQAGGLSLALARWWEMRTAHEPLVVAGYLLGFGCLQYLVGFPLHFYGSFLLEHRFQLSRMTPGAWWVREAKRVALGGALGLLLVEGLYALLRAAPSSWPVWATAGWVLVSVGLARIFPTILLPIFYKTARLDDAALTERLLELCRRAGLPALGVFRFHLGAETRKANAALAGLGKSRRVLLSDTLTEEFTPEEIEGVLAHELAHHRYRHITKMLVLSAAGSWIAFALSQAAGARWVVWLGLRSLSDVAGLPVLLLWFSVLGIIGLPLQNGIARYFEWQADRFAVALAHAPRAFAEALRRLARLNLADPTPPRWVVWWLYDHPPIAERIQAAEAAAVPREP